MPGERKMTVKRGKLRSSSEGGKKERGGKRKGKVSTGGRNNRGRRTVRHRGGGVKRARRRVESGMSQNGKRIGRVRSVGYDPGRSGKIARRKVRGNGSVSKKSEYVYVLAVEGREVGSVIQFSVDALGMGGSVGSTARDAAPSDGLHSQSLGSTRRRSEMAVGTKLCNLSLKEGGVGKYRRSGGVHGELVAQVAAQGVASEASAGKGDAETEAGKAVGRKTIVQIRREGGKRREVPGWCTATVGVVARSFVRHKKAGTNRRLGWRPTVRGEAMNPVDHPHGGRTRGGRPEVTPWARRAKGVKTRKG